MQGSLKVSPPRPVETERGLRRGDRSGMVRTSRRKYQEPGRLRVNSRGEVAQTLVTPGRRARVRKLTGAGVVGRVVRTARGTSDRSPGQTQTWLDL